MEYEKARTRPGTSGEIGVSAQSTGWFFAAPDAAAAGVILNGRLDGRLGYSPNGWLSFGLQGGIVRGYSTGTDWKGDYYSADAYPYIKVGIPRLSVKLSAGYSFTFRENGKPSVHDKFPNAYADFLVGIGEGERSTVVVRLGGTPIAGIGVGYVFHAGGLSIAGMVSGIPYIVGGHVGLHIGAAYGF